MHAVFWVGAGNEDASVRHEHQFGVVEARNNSAGHDAEALVDGERGVVEHGVVIRILGKTETGDSLLGTVGDQIRSVGKGADAGHNTLGGHALKCPCGSSVFGGG